MAIEELTWPKTVPYQIIKQSNIIVRLCQDMAIHYTNG